MNYFDNLNNRRQFVDYLVKFDKDQLLEITLGKLIGLTVDQICLYARPDFNYRVMAHIKQCMIDKMHIDKIKFMVDTGFDYPKMIIVSNAFYNGFTIDEVKSFAYPDVTYDSMYKAYHDMLDAKKSSC